MITPKTPKVSFRSKFPVSQKTILPPPPRNCHAAHTASTSCLAIPQVGQQTHPPPLGPELTHFPTFPAHFFAHFLRTWTHVLRAVAHFCVLWAHFGTPLGLFWAPCAHPGAHSAAHLRFSQIWGPRGIPKGASVVWAQRLLAGTETAFCPSGRCSRVGFSTFCDLQGV